MQNRIRSGQMSWFPCGGAWIVGIKKNTKFGKVFARLAEIRGSGYGLYGPRSAAIHWTLSGPEGQNMYLDEEASKTFVENVNSQLGLDLSVRTYID